MKSTRTPMAEKALYLSHFTPSMMQPETLQAMLVQRQPLLDACYDDVVHSVSGKAKHHYLFVGPRGIGKTHLVSLLHHRLVNSPEVRQHGLVAWMREEEWGVTSFFEWVLRVLRTLDQSHPKLDIASQTAPLYDMPRQQAEAKATSLLIEVLGHKTLVVLLENLDDLFDQLGDAGQRQLRGFVQNHPQVLLVATTPSLFAGVSLQKSPFYGFFDIQALQEFSLEDVTSLLTKIAIERGDPSLAEFIATPEGRARIRAVHHLAEGNPRIYVIFAQFLSRAALDELVQAVMHTLDELTPYYQARMKELSGQQRKIVEYLVHYRGAAPVKQIAKACFMTQQTCSGQLKQLRDKRYVRAIEQGRESYYELTEPLMRLCMEVKQQRGEPIGLFVEILRIWFTEAELHGWLEAGNAESELGELYVRRALEAVQVSQNISPVLEAQFRELSNCASARNPGQMTSILEEIATTSPANRASKTFRAVLLLAMLDTTPSLKPHLLSDIDSYAAALMESIGQRAEILSKTNAVVTYTGLLLASRGLTGLNDIKGSAAILKLSPMLLGYPSHAAVAILNIAEMGEASTLPLFLSRVFQALTDLTVSGSASKFVRVLSRIVESASRWKESGDEKHLLALPREERKLILTSEVKPIAMHTPQNTSNVR